jgi:hypothetical protein
MELEVGHRGSTYQLVQPNPYPCALPGQVRQGSAGAVNRGKFPAPPDRVR